MVRLEGLLRSFFQTPLIDGLGLAPCHLQPWKLTRVLFDRRGLNEMLEELSPLFYPICELGYREAFRVTHRVLDLVPHIILVENVEHLGIEVGTLGLGRVATRTACSGHFLGRQRAPQQCSTSGNP